MRSTRLSNPLTKLLCLTLSRRRAVPLEHPAIPPRIDSVDRVNEITRMTRHTLLGHL